MTTGENDETGGVGCVILGEGETGDGNQKPSPSFTTLSTIAIQAGQSQIVVSVLQSGSLLHLQLVQVHPGLCEIGLSKDENQMLIQEQQQLIEKLKKHEREVLAVVENRQESERRKKKNKEIKKGEDVDEAMVASLSEGWSLLLHLLERRQEVLMLASDFFQKAQEFGVSINRAENLQIKPDDEKQVTYNSMSRDLLGKSLHVLTSSSVLLQKLRQLQRTEVLLKRGRALQQEEESSHCSRGMVLKLEEMVEMLQDRRRKVDRTIRLQLQQVKDNIMNCKKEEESRQKCGPDEILDQIQQCESTSAPKTAENLQSDSRTEETTVWQFGSRSENTGLLDSASRSDSKELQPKGSSSKETRDLQSGLRSVLKPGFVLKEKINLQPGSKSEDNRDLQSGSKFDLKPGSRSEAGEVGLSELSRDQDETKDVPSRQQVGPQSMLGNKTENREDHAHQTFLTNRRQQLLLSCEQLLDKVWSWVQQGSSVLSNCSEARLQLCEAEDSLNTHLQLHTQAESAGLDAENLRRVLDQITALHTDSTSRDSGHPPSEPSRQLSPLKALTEQLKKGSIGKQTRTSTTSSSLEADSSFTFSPELTGRVDLVLKELQSLNRKLNSNLQLLQLYVTFLRAAQQVEEEVEELKEMCRRRPEEEQESPSSCSHVRSPQKKKQVDACWQETLQRCHTAQEMGHDCVHTVTTVSGSGLNLQALLWAVQQMLERLSKTEQEVNELQTQQLQEDMRFYRKYHDRLLKSQQDLKSVSELLDSCTSMDLGLDLQTSRLQEHFIQARPHLIKLDAEVEYTVRSWESLRGVQERLEVKEEEVLSCVELLKLQKRVKDKIQQSESILNRTSSFHLTAKKLEALLQSDPASNSTGSTGLCGSTEAELRRHRDDRQQIQSLFETASTLKTEICTAVKHSGCTCFRVQQLETRLLDLDSLCSSWLREAARREEKLHRQLLTDALNDDISQLRDSFKELKKRFSNTKFNYLKRNDRTRNMKAIRNQLQQVETYKEKLQVLRKRLQAVMSRLGSDVKDRSAARQTEDAVNELQRQMGEFERSVSEYQKTLDMTCRLQKAMEEYQFWCEEASATIARVGKFSLECRSTEAVSVLSRQFEKFVWPTVPQQEERISQMTELAVTLHGEEDGRRYVEKTVSKHSQMVESIRKLSDGLMELEAKLKMESLKQQQHEIKEESPMEQRTEEETQEKDEDKEKKTKGNRKMKKKEQMDNRSTQESADVYELKETGHTPELTSEQEGREVLMKTQTAANKKPQLRKSPSQEPDSERSERLTSSYFSTHTFILSCTPVEAHRQAHAIQATLPYSRTGSSLTDIRRKERQETGQQNVSAGGLMELELQQQEAMTEDSLSTDDYECVSPDDISLPPLAETPESIMVQSDIEDGFCFSCHSVHISQYSHHYPTQPEHHGSSTATAQQQTESSQTDGGLTPPTSLHSSTRFRSESSSFVQCPLTGSAPVPNMFTSTLCGNLRTEETITSDFPQSDDLPMGNAEMSFTSGSNLVHRSNTTDRLNDVPVKRSSLQSEHNSQNKQPRRNSHGENTQNVTYIHGILPKTDPLLQAADLIPSPTLPQILSPNLDLNKGKTYSQHTGFLLNTRTDNYQDSLTECFSDTGSGLNQAINSQIIKETFSGYSSSSPQASFLPQSETSPQIDTAASLKDTSSSFTATTTGTQQGVYSLSSSSEGHCTLEQPGSKENLFSTGAGDLPDVHVPILLEPNDISNIKISSSTTINSNRFINNQSYQTVYSLHESLTSTSTQQCVHDSGSRPAAPPQPEAQMQALAQQANLHAHPHHHPSSPPHILTPDRDPDICQPMAIREEIRLTPQIQGPPLPAPPSPLPRAQTESLPQGKASTYVPTCFTRPLSRATVMEGSPVTLEVEVTGESKPTLTWFKDGEVSATSLGRVLACEDEKHFLFIPEASDSDGGLYKVRAANYQNSQLVASSSSDKWSMAEVLDTISVDWQTWFGTLCVLLWLLYLIVL